MLWDPGSVKKNEGEEEPDNVPITPILVPLQSQPATNKKVMPVLVPDVQDLKDQFQQQQNMLTQIKETLKENESQLSSKGKQVEVYANKLSQIRARSKNTQGKKSSTPDSSTKSLVKKSSKDNLTKIEDDKTSGDNSKLLRKGKVSELKKCLEENKLKFEERTGKEQSETKKIESLVEQLKMQLEERDKTIQDLQKNIEQPTPKPDASLPRKTKQKSDKESVASKTTQTNLIQPSEDSIEVIALQNKIYELEANVLDLEENLKEKENVIEARTQAVTLLSQDLSLKGKNTLESLEETRQEMRTMQTNFIAIEDQLKKDILDRDNRLAVLDEKGKKLESINFELSLKNAELQEKLVNIQEKYVQADAERNTLKKSSSQGESDDKFEELTKKIGVLTKELDDRNKSMIKMKIEHKNKLKSLNKTLETLKGTSDDKAEIVRLNSLIEEFENVKIGLENRVAELEDEKATEKKLKDQINELEILIQKQNEDISLHLKKISNLEKEKLNLIQTNQDQEILIENLHAKIQNMEPEKKEEADQDSKWKELSRKIEEMEVEHNKKLENLKAEHCKEIEMLESYYNTKFESLERKELEEYRISTEINNIHVEEQIELLVTEKQQLLEKLKSLSGVSSTDSLTFEKMEHSDLRDDKESAPHLGEEVDLNAEGTNRMSHLQRIVNEQQVLINELQKTINDEKQKSSILQEKVKELEGTIRHLEDLNITFKQQIEMSEPTESGKNQKSNVNAKNRIKKIEMELSQGRKTIEEQSQKLKELHMKLEEKEELIKNYTEKIELFEKDDWDRQNHWQNNEDQIENYQELQKKCLSLENSLIEVSEDCERLRKENIEVVHLLSEEKVKRKKLLEQMQSEPGLEEKINAFNETIKELEAKVGRLELSHSKHSPAGDNQEIAELQGKLEWTNVVLTSKETEMFRLQSLLEDRCKTIEILEGDLTEYKAKLEERDKNLNEIVGELKAKEVQMGEISANFDRLQNSVDVTNQKTASNESQVKELVATVKEMEEVLKKKESELQEIKGALAEKNLELTNLRNRLEEVNYDLTHSYQEHLENMKKCLRDKESEYDALLVEKNHLEEINKTIVSDKEEIYNQKSEVLKENEKLQTSLTEKEKIIVELTEKLNCGEGTKPKSQEIDDLKLKIKKLAVNLKKKAQNETELTKQVKELEGSLTEKERIVEELKKGVSEFTEKWTVEKSEKEQLRNDLSQVIDARAALENEKAGLKEIIGKLERDLENSKLSREPLEAKVLHLEKQLSELSQLYQNANTFAEGAQHEMEERKMERETLLQKLAEITGKYEEIKFKHNQILLEKEGLEKRLEEVQFSASERSSFDAKMQENMAVIESLETELKKAHDQMKTVEEKFFYSEERRVSLENKNEEMCKKIMEDSETLVTIDDLSVRIEELVKSEKVLQDTVKVLEAANSELKQSLDEVQSEKFTLEAELKSSVDKIMEITGELKQLRDADGEKNNSMRQSNKEIEKLKADNKQLLSEFEKLNRDYEQCEVDFKENIENSQNIEKSLKHRIEELTNENAVLTERCNLLEERSHQEVEEEKKPKKKKSVTFRTDEVEYIKDLKNQLHNYDASLKQANEEIETLKAELFREKLKSEVTNVVAEAQEKVETIISTPEKKIPVIQEPEIQKVQAKPLAMEKSSPVERKFDANVFFGGESSSEGNFFDQAEKTKSDETQSSPDNSLMWDDGWGTDGHLEEEYLLGREAEGGKSNTENQKLIELLQSEVAKLQTENERLLKESQDQVTKYAKAIKKLKELKAANDKLSKAKSSSGFGDLDAAIVDELKSQIQNMETKEKELMKNLENSRQEKESLLKKIDVLNAGNEKFLEMKERQDNEVEIWQRKNAELLKEITELRQQLEEPVIQDDNLLMKENRELKNKIEALEWKNCELNELLEENQEMLEKRSKVPSSDVEKVMEEKSILQKEIEELNNVKERLEKKLFDEEKKSSQAIGELNERLTALASEKETLQDMLGGMKKAEESEKPKEKIFDYFKSSPEQDLFSIPAQKNEVDVKLNEIESLRQRTIELENLLRNKDKEVNIQTQALQGRILELENIIKLREDNLSAVQQKIAGVESYQQKLVELENGLRLRDEELHQLRNVNLSQNKEVEELREYISEREMEIGKLRESLFELETLLKLRDEDLQHVKLNSEKEIETLKQKLSELKNVSTVSSQFETINLNQSPEVSQKEDEMEMLRQKILELENVISSKDGELEQVHHVKEHEAENLRQRIFELEDLLRLREEELNRLQVINWNDNEGKEVENLREKTRQMEDFVRFKENELYQLQNVKENEIQNLNQRIYELENLLKAKDSSHQFPQVESYQQKIFELEHMIRFKEEETHRLLLEKANEIENLMQRLSELENLLPAKDEEINQMMIQLNELQKSYNDSKLEIERLLNEEKLNTEEKFVEPFQKNIQIPVSFEVEALSRTLSEEKQKLENLKYELTEKDNQLLMKNEEIKQITEKLVGLETKTKELTDEENKQKEMKEKFEKVKTELEQVISDRQQEIESSNLQLSIAKRELEEFQIVKNEAMSNLQSQLFELETELVETREKSGLELTELRYELNEMKKLCESLQREKAESEIKTKEEIEELKRSKQALEKDIEMLKSELESKENDIISLDQILGEERSQLLKMKEVLEAKENEVLDLKQTLTHLQEEISHFRNFEKQVKELRVAQLQEADSEMSVTPEGHPDLSDWTEHELAELSERLQSDLDTALYMLHQRDVRCDELTFELMQLLEERDTLQLRLSTALRINEENKSHQKAESTTSSHALEESKDLVDQSNDRQNRRTREPSEDLRQLASKISELHSVSYLRDKTVKDDSMQRHKEQMNLLSRVSDADISLSRDVQSSPTVLLNWVRGKTTPKVMHI